MPHQERSKEMQNCLDNCLNCHTVCLETIHHCLEMGGKHADAKHISLLHECAEICMTSAHFLIGMSDFHPQVCGVCADICEACAKSCESLAAGDGEEFMQRCADICRRCAESCRRMASGTATTASM